MRTAMMVGLACVLVACPAGSSDIGPDPSSSNTTTSGGANGTGGDGAASDGGAPSGGAGPGSDFESGSRLKRRFVVGDDGSRAPLGLYDSELDTPCQWAKANDSVTRCLPSPSALSFYYLDAACSNPIGAASCSISGEYAWIVDGCTQQTRVYPIGSPTSQPSGQLYAMSGVTCVAVPTPNVNFYGIGNQIAPANFVGGAAQNEL